MIGGEWQATIRTQDGKVADAADFTSREAAETWIAERQQQERTDG
jgi:hypothetical protein